MPTVCCEEFQFSDRASYERELVSLVRLGDEEAYERLAEEFVAWCDSQLDGSSSRV